MLPGPQPPGWGRGAGAVFLACGTGFPPQPLWVGPLRNMCLGSPGTRGVSFLLLPSDRGEEAPTDQELVNWWETKLQQDS